MQRFIADAAHQLRTPLAVLQTQAELALRENTSPDLKTTLAQLQDSTRRATRLANQLLDHARASSDISTLNIVPLDLSALAADTTRELVPLALRHAIDLGLEAEPGIQIQGDGVLLRELLKNLIDNAIRYCPAGACITVRVSAAGSAGISLEVEDNGPGIAAAERHRVFDRFYRIPGSYTDGSGLGLAIVKEIVRLHSGKISLGEGTGGGGLKVQILLPA
jgi:two-component system sensor histidine kinase TctE